MRERSRGAFFSFPFFVPSQPLPKKNPKNQNLNNSVEEDKAFEVALAEFWSCPDRDAAVAAKLVERGGGGSISAGVVRSRLALLEVRREERRFFFL